MGIVNLPDVKAPACKPDHLDLNADLRRAGVPLSHDRKPTHAEVGYAMLVGLTAAASAVIARLGPDDKEKAELFVSLRSALTRHMLAAQPFGQRTFGPEPLAQAGRTHRSQRLSATVPLEDFPVRLVGLFTLLGDTAQATLGSTEQEDDYVSALRTMAEAAPLALKWPGEVGEQRTELLGLVTARGLAQAAALIEALVELDPYEHSDEQRAAVAAAGAPLRELEPHLLSLFSAVGAAETDEQVSAALDTFLAACGGL